MGKGDELTGNKKPKPPSSSVIRRLWLEGNDAEIRRLREEYHGKLETWRRDQDIAAAQTKQYRDALDRVIADLKSGVPNTYSYAKVEAGQGMSALGQVNELLSDLEDTTTQLASVKDALNTAAQVAASIHESQDSEHAEKASQLLASAESEADNTRAEIDKAKDELEQLRDKLASL